MPLAKPRRAALAVPREPATGGSSSKARIATPRKPNLVARQRAALSTPRKP